MTLSRIRGMGSMLQPQRGGKRVVGGMYKGWWAGMFKKKKKESSEN